MRFIKRLIFTIVLLFVAGMLIFGIAFWNNIMLFFGKGDVTLKTENTIIQNVSQSQVLTAPQTSKAANGDTIITFQSNPGQGVMHAKAYIKDGKTYKVEITVQPKTFTDIQTIPKVTSLTKQYLGSVIEENCIIGMVAGAAKNIDFKKKTVEKRITYGNATLDVKGDFEKNLNLTLQTK